MGSNQHVAVLWLAILSTPHMSGSQVTGSILVMFYQAFSENAPTIPIYGHFFLGTWEKNGIGGLRGILRWFQTDTSDFFWGLGSDSINGYESSLASRPPKTHSDLGCPKSLRNCPCSTQRKP